LLIGQAINLLTGPVGPLLVATGHQRLAFALAAVALILNAVLNISLIPCWGLLGAAISTSVSLSCLYLSALLAARWRLDLWPYDKRLWKGVVAAIAAIGSAYAAIHVPLANSLLSVVLEFCAAGAAFVAVLVFMGLDSEDLQLLGVLRRALADRSEPT
jgi:O-antigen/teichoic acid export membrane protein